MVTQPIYRRDASRALAICERTIAALVGVPFTKQFDKISLAKLAKALRADPTWIVDCVEGRDAAVSRLHAVAVLGGLGRTKPRARLRKGERYSARELGLLPMMNVGGQS